MDKHTQHFIETLRHISLTERERLDMRSRLESYIDFHTPVNAPHRGAVMHAPRSFFTGHFRWMQGVAAFVLVIVVGTSTSFAAEKSIPGDALYAIKVSINEPVRVALAVSPKSKATVATELVQRRLEEATQLAVEKKLTHEDSVSLAARIQTSVRASEDAAGILETAGDHEAALEARSDLESKLVANTQVMQLIAAQETLQQDTHVSDFLGVVASTTRIVAAARQHSEVSIVEATTTERRQGINKSSKRNLQEAAHNLVNLSDSSSTVLVVEAQASIDIGQQALAQAEDTDDATVAAHTYILSQYAKRIAEETSAAVRAAKTLGISPSDLHATTTDDVVHEPKNNEHKEEKESDQPATTTLPDTDSKHDDDY